MSPGAGNFWSSMGHESRQDGQGVHDPANCRKNPRPFTGEVAAAGWKGCAHPSGEEKAEDSISSSIPSGSGELY
jgi:hypothetical protein